MSHSLNKIWVHVILGTKKGKRMIIPEIEKDLYNFLAKQLTELGCSMKAINGTTDHIHMLFLLNRTESISEVMKQLKGSSSYWVNSNRLIKNKFEWQVGYAAFSVSEFNVEMIANYIKKQKEHHASKTYNEEIISLNSLITP